MNMTEETLLLEKVKPYFIKILDKHFRLEFKAINDKTYTVFIDKDYIEKDDIFKLNDYFDVIKVDVYREGLGEVVDDSKFDTEPHLKYCGVYSYLTIVPNHLDPAKFNILN
jgi:hypothetical protein